ncbi:four helix bundle protein [Arcicella aurantiaca]|uniref:Four helix bundle protein n=1 Tax=Arcicella aurantiaca TaxID=591202 RepID=A0A316EZY1_9BACT|nr:four helix bundle protein [Arcicella aurantiaca]PWK28856.1 four helix bundle protein [Arcicella aurantiaca]
MHPIRTHRDLLVWQKSMVLVTEIYLKSRSFPVQEQYGLTSQIRRAAISIPSNIAEGFGRQSTGDYLRFLNIAVGSLFELQTQIEIALNLEFIGQADFEIIFEKSREIDRMLSSLIQKLKIRKEGGVK